VEKAIQIHHKNEDTQVPDINMIPRDEEKIDKFLPKEEETHVFKVPSRREKSRGEKEPDKDKRNGKEKVSKDKEREKDRRKSRSDREKEKERGGQRRDNKPREKDKERNRDRDEQRGNTENFGDLSSIPSGTTNTNGEIEISVEETNKIRASLGLKPLKVAMEDTKEKEEQDKDKLKKKQQADKESKSFLLKEKLKKAKKQREYLSNVTGKSLGEELEDEDEGVTSWVNKSRNIHEKEKELADKRAKMLDDQDEELKENSYSSKDLKGIKIGHQLDKFLEESGEQVILTFDDTSVLKDANTLNEEEAQLINLKVKEKEILERNKERTKKETNL